jgi:hypothetical protein
MEKWKDIKGYEGLYQVSDLGRVKSLRRSVHNSSNGGYFIDEKILKQSNGGNNYMSETLKFGNGQWATKVGSTLAYNDEGGNFKPLPFNFTRSTGGTRVNKDGLIEVVTNNKPRIDYLNDSNGALLLEPQRTNLALSSEEINNTGFWQLTNSGTITANSTISPDGYQNADTLNAGAAFSQVQGTILGTSGVVYTVSIWVKRITGTGNVFLRAVENANTLIAVTSDWQRFTATVTSTTTTIRIGINLATSGDAVAVWGGQIEAGKEQAESKIKSLGTAQDENGNEYPTHKHTIVQLGNIVLEQGQYDENGEEVVAPVLSDKWHVDALWLDLEADEEGKVDHPYGWKSYAVNIDGNGVHSFLGLDYNSYKF